MRKSLLLAVIAATACALGARAVNVDDFDGRIAAMQFMGNVTELSLPEVTSTARIVKTGTNTFKLESFLKHYTLNGCTLNADGSITVPLRQTMTSTDGTRTMTLYEAPQINSVYKINGVSGFRVVNVNGATTYLWDRTAATSMKSQGAYAKLPTSLFYGWQLGTASVNIAVEETVDGVTTAKVMRAMQIHIIPDNATATESDGTTYRVGLALGTDDNFIIANLHSAGLFYENYLVGQTWNTTWKPELAAKINHLNNTFSILAQVCGGSSKSTNLGYGTYQITRGYGQSASTINHDGYAYTVANRAQYKKYICSSGTPSGTSMIGMRPVTGSFTISNPWQERADGTGGQSWVAGDAVPGGRLTQWADFSLHLETMKIYDMETSAWLHTASSTDIMPDNNGRLDITHQCEIQVQKCGFSTCDGEDLVYVRGTIHDLMNSRFVHSHELYIMPGEVTSYADAAFDDITKGHTSAVSLDQEAFLSDWDPEVSAVAAFDGAQSDTPAAYDGDGVFRRLIRVSDLGDAASADGKYTIFVKTRYTQMNLSPSFHAAKLLVADGTTALPQTLASGERRVAGLYDLQGRPVDAAYRGLVVARYSDGTAATRLQR